MAALGLLILVFLNSKKGSGTVAPAAVQTPSLGGSSGQTGPTASDVTSAIQTALQGYVTTGQEQADLANLSSSQQGLLATAAAQLKQAETQDVATVTGNLSQLSAQFLQSSQQWAQAATTLTGQQQQLAEQQAAQQRDFSQQLSQQSNQIGQNQTMTAYSIEKLRELQKSIGGTAAATVPI